MRHETFPIEVLNDTLGGGGQSVVVDRFREKTVQIHGAAGWSSAVQVEGVVGDHDDWLAISSTITGGAFVSVPQAVDKIRINTLHWVSGTVEAEFGGFDSRSE